MSSSSTQQPKTKKVKVSPPPSTIFKFKGDRDTVTSVDIPAGFTGIGSACFIFCRSLVSVTIPDSVTTIQYCAFKGCTSLSSIILPDSVTTIGGAAFYQCSSLSSIIGPDSVTTIGTCAFYECSSLSSIIIPNSVTAIGEYVFSDCTSLSSILIPDTAIGIRENAFAGCSVLKEKADEAGLSVVDWGKLNWRKAKTAEVRMTIVLSIKQLQKLSDEKLAAHISTISNPISGKAARFLVECGEPGLVREIVKFCGFR
jgi:hypothetical protein